MRRAAHGPRRELAHESRVLLYALLAGAPAVVVACVLLAGSDLAAKNVWTLGALLVVWWLGCAAAAREEVVHTLHAIANLVGAVREGDYSFRGRRSRGDDALSGAMRELNALGATLRERRLDAMEASALVEKVIEAIDVAVFTFDGDRRLRLVNRAGAKLIGEQDVAVGATAQSLGLAGLLDGPAPRTIDLAFAHHGKRPWELRRAAFRLRGLPHELVVVTDLQRALRQEERLVWQRLVRVLGHEINNSLAPIQSIATQMREMLLAPGRPPDWEDDVRSGLAVVARRAEALGRFLGAYAKLARLPPPSLCAVDVGGWIRRVASLETRVRVEVTAGPVATIAADADQLDQLLINLVRNAAEAALETQGRGVDVSWRTDAGELEVIVADDGPGLGSTENLFVPFFTTKPTGTGIGLVLSRQIAEAHGGALTLESREDRRGSVARVRLRIGERDSAGGSRFTS